MEKMSNFEIKKARHEYDKAAWDSQHGRNKLTARERLELLFDKGTFVEVGAFVQSRCTDFGMESKHIDGDGVITGYGQVNGRIVFAYAQDFTCMGGSLGEMHANKICSIMDKALSAQCPVVGLNDSGGARIQEGIDSLAGYGRIFFRNTKASGKIPQITAIMGPCAGGAVYSPAITDFILMVEGTGKMFITGPDVIKAVTGDTITDQDLGGSTAHMQKSGVAHFSDSSDNACIDRIKELLSYLPDNCNEKPHCIRTKDQADRKLDNIENLISKSSSKGYDMHRIIEALVDDGRVLEYQKDYAQNIICCFGRLDGMSVGIVASQPQVKAGCIDINASDKASRFVRTCDCFNIPLITLVDVPGYLPGAEQEHGGIIRHGAKLLFAYSEATVPKLTVVLRKAYGGAYLAMCCRELGADYTFAWPDSEIAVMGADGAVNIIFRKDSPMGKALHKEEYIEKFSNPYIAARHLLIDEVIDPKSTRAVLVSSLKTLANKTAVPSGKKHGNIPL